MKALPLDVNMMREGEPSVEPMPSPVAEIERLRKRIEREVQARREAEDSAERAAQELEDILTNIPVAVVSLSGTEILTANASALTLFGFATFDAFKAASPGSWFRSAEDWQQFMSAYRGLDTEAGALLEWPFYRSDRTSFWAELYVKKSAVERKAEQVLWLVTDVSSRRWGAAQARFDKLLAELKAATGSQEDLLGMAVREICEATGWAVGQAWIAAADNLTLRLFRTWCRADTDAIAHFLQASSDKAFARGQGLPGRVWASGRSAWIADVQNDANFPRKAAASAAGLHGAYAFPVHAGNRIVAILEFFFSAEIEREPELFVRYAQRLSDVIASKQLEREREEAEATLAAAFEVAAIGVALRALDPEQPRFLRVNRKLCEIFGYSQEELLQKTTVDLTPPEERQMAIDYNMRMRNLATTGYTREKRYVRKDGRVITTEVSLAPVLDSSGKPTCVITFIQDITDRKRLEKELQDSMEAALRESEARMAGLLDTPLVAVVSFEADGCITQSNAAARDMFLYTADTMRAHRFGDLIASPALREQIAAESVAQDRVGKGVVLDLHNRVEFEGVRSDGSRFPAEMALSSVGAGGRSVFTATIRDVTQRKRQERAILDRTSRLNLVFDLSPDGFVACDTQGRIVSVNPAFERLTGITPGTLLGASADALQFVLRACCDPAKAFPDWIFTEATQKEAVFHVTRPERRVLLAMARGDLDETGKIFYFRDITREIEVDRLKSEFVATAAHELRTPTTSVLGFSELLLTREYDEARRTDMLRSIHDQAQLLAKLVNQLLDLSRMDESQGTGVTLEPCDVFPVIRKITAGLKMPGDPREVELQLPDTAPLLDVEVARFTLALTNVLSNAYKYSNGRGAIRITLHKREHHGRQQIGIAVRDHGIGMTPEQLEHVFDRFWRADQTGATPGSGLGMALVRETIETLGGDVSVESEFGRGTEVTLWLCVSREPQCEGAVASSVAG